MNPRLKTLRTVLFRLGILVGLALLAIQIFQAYQAFKSQVIFINNYLPLCLAGILITISFLQQIAAWSLLMRSLNIRLPAHKARFIYALSFLARYIPGSIWGYISRSEWLFQNYQISYTASNYGSILEVALAACTGIFVIGVCMLLNSTLAPVWLGVCWRFSLFCPGWPGSADSRSPGEKSCPAI